MADCQESKGTTEKAPWEDRWLRMYRKCGNISVACQAADVTRWNRLAGNGLDFEVPNAGRKLIFTAFNSIGPGRRYSIYWKVG